MSETKLTTVNALVAEYLAVKQPRWSANTYAAAEPELRRFLAFIGGRELTPKVIAEYQAEQHNRTCTPTTRFRAIEWPQRFLEWLEDMEYVGHNRFSKILVKPPKPLNKVKAFTHAQFEALKNEAKGTMWYYAIIMAYRTGTRYSDTALMKWESINFEKRYIQYVPWKSRKTGREAICPFEAGGDLHMVLLELNDQRHADPMWARFVCPEMAMTYPMTGISHAPAIMRYEFDRLRRKVGAAKGLSFHSLRHAFISRLIKGGTTFSVGSQLTGMASESVFLRYADPDLPTLQKAIEDMNKGDDPPEEGTIIKLPGAA